MIIAPSISALIINNLNIDSLIVYIYYYTLLKNMIPGRKIRRTSDQIKARLQIKKKKRS